MDGVLMVYCCICVVFVPRLHWRGKHGLHTRYPKYTTLDWTGLDWTRLDCIALHCTALYWNGYPALTSWMRRAFALEVHR